MKRQSEESKIWDKIWDGVHRFKQRCECGHHKVYHSKRNKGTCSKCDCWFYKEVYEGTK
jgi:hypothetical protein